MLRFKVGELALVGYNRDDEGIGEIVEVIKVGPMSSRYIHDRVADYHILMRGEIWDVKDHVLIKLGDPGEELKEQEEEQEEIESC
jgi:hypothetical protein